MMLPVRPLASTKVVPLAGDVDRNTSLLTWAYTFSVVPLAGDVDRNVDRRKVYIL